MAQATGWAGSRRLLRVLRDIMKGGGSPQERLDRIVDLIAQDMVAEVCSVYVMRAGEVLELFATKGLAAEAVHRTRLSVGEGLVGHIALTGRPMRLADAQSHRKFAYRPETGEEIYSSLMGVPILRDGRVLGVLVVQNVSRRSYAEEELEALETVAMVLAELVASGELVGAEEARHAEGAALLPVRLAGITLNAGLAMGRVVAHDRGIVIHRLVAEDTEAEVERLRRAVREMRAALDDLLRDPGLSDAGEHREVLESYRMFAEDRGWLERIREAARGGLTAEAAVQKVQNDTRARMAQVKDAYLRQRLADLDDLGNRLLQHLLGAEGSAAADDLPEDVVLVARDLGPAELLDYERARLAAVVLEEGAPTSHAAIVARALEIPVVGRCRGLLAEARPGDEALVDGDNAQVILRPGEAVRHGFAEAMAARSRRRAAYAAGRDRPAVTRDGVRVGLYMNAGLLADLPQLEATGADGIGLYRTEVPFMVRRSFPGIDEQAELYGRVLAAAGGRPVVFRTLDVGGDKTLPYWGDAGDANPAMGWRAMRIALDRPAMLRRQLRALIRATAGGELSLMFPMVSEVAELAAGRDYLARELERHRAAGEPPPEAVRVGVMLEVPALLWQLRALFARVDFVAVGSNDLLQFLFASDRGNPRLARRYDVLSPPVLGFLADLARRAEAAGVPLSVCGEMAGHPLEAMALLGCGVRTLSMAPAGIGPVRGMVRSLELAPLAGYVERLARGAEHSVRGHLRAYALDHGVELA